PCAPHFLFIHTPTTQISPLSLHDALPLAYGCHVDLPVVLGDSELLAPPEVRCDLCAVDDVLARKTRDVRAGAAHILSLDRCRLHPLFGQRPGEELASCSAAEDEQIVFLRFDRRRRATARRSLV